MAIPVVASYTVNDSGGATATSITLTKPDGVEVGDLLVIIAGNDDLYADRFFDAIDGWTQFVNAGDNVSASKLSCYWRIADGSEGATIAVTTNEYANEIYGWYLRITGADTTAPINVIGTPDIVNSVTSHPITQVSTTVDDCLAFYCLAFDGGDGFPFSVAGTGWTETDDVQSGTGLSDACGCWGTKEQASLGATGAATVTSSVSDGSVSVQFAVASSEEAPPGWAHKYLGVANASIGKISGVAIADILKVNGVA